VLDVREVGATGTPFTCFTGTKVQILTAETADVASEFERLCVMDCLDEGVCYDASLYYLGACFTGTKVQILTAGCLL
jgi:hypothetical protein